jgi:SAM-dependent methyltransferase
MHAAIKQHIRHYYTLLFRDTQPNKLPISTAKSLAQLLGYSLDSLDFIPEPYWDKFLPCGNPLIMLNPCCGDRILNLGCGAAIDSFVLHANYGQELDILNLDIVFNVLRDAACLSQIANRDAHTLTWVCGDGENLPIADECVDWVLMNGSFNLFPEKASVLQEIRRVLKPAGFLVGADLCTAAVLPDYFRQEMDAWAWCLSGACCEQELYNLLTMSRFKQLKILRGDKEEMFYRVTFSCQK